MKEPRTNRFVVVIEDAVPRGGLNELEQVTNFLVVDVQSGQVVLSFQGLMEASFSSLDGNWEDYRWSGVAAVTVVDDEQSVVVQYHDGRVETAWLTRQP